MGLSESWQLVCDCIAPQATSTLAMADAVHNSRSVGTWQALFSDRARPLLLPATNREARQNSLQFFLPERWRKYYACMRLRADIMLKDAARLPLLTLSATSATLPERLAVTESPQLAFLIGTPGPYQKASMLVMTPRGEPLSLAKIALGREANSMVIAESTWLRRLSAHREISGFVPRLLREGTTPNGNRYIAQSLVNGWPSASAFSRLHADFLRRLSTLDCRLLQFPYSPSYRSLSDNFARLAPLLSRNRREFLAAALSDTFRTLYDWFGPFVISHGDFAFWNMRTNDDRIQVFDWEYANEGVLPLFDVFHFHLIVAATSGRTLRIRDLKYALAAARAYALLAFPKFDWSTPIVAAQALAYLLHTLIFYGISQGEFVESHPVVRSYCQLIEERTQWLQ